MISGPYWTKCKNECGIPHELALMAGEGNPQAPEILGRSRPGYRAGSGGSVEHLESQADSLRRRSWKILQAVFPGHGTGNAKARLSCRMGRSGIPHEPIVGRRRYLRRGGHTCFMNYENKRKNCSCLKRKTNGSANQDSTCSRRPPAIRWRLVDGDTRVLSEQRYSVWNGYRLSVRLKKATLGAYDFEQNAYSTFTIDHTIEILHCTGNISMLEGKPLRSSSCNG